MTMISFRKDFGFGTWWPDYDHAPEACYGRVVRRLPGAAMCEPYLRNRELVVQAGGHAGLWPMFLAKRFKRVLTFECEPALHACMLENVARARVKNIECSDNALGPMVGPVQMRPHCSAGSWSIHPSGTVTVNQVSIDSLNLPHCSAIILDVEAYEVPVLQGALETIARFAPPIHVERSNAGEQEAFFKSIGYVYAAKTHGDVLYIKGGK